MFLDVASPRFSKKFGLLRRGLASTFLMLIFPAMACGATLDGLIHQALTSYPSILSRQSSRDAAQSDLTAAKLRFLPNPSFNTQRNNVRFDGGLAASQMPSTNVSVSQPLFIDGGIIAGYNKADARLSAADYSLLESREDISKRVINAYTEWFKSWTKIQALEESLRLHEKFAGMISRRFEQGVASGADKDLGVSRFMQAKADLDTQRSQEESALASLSELVGESIKRKDLVNSVVKHISIPPRSEGIDKAQRQSVTIQRYKFEAEAAEQEAKEVRAQAVPQLSLQAQRQIGNAYYPGAQGFNAVGLVVTYSPGGGLSNIAGTRAAFERAKAAELQVETAKRELTERLNAEFNEYEFSLLKKESLLHSANLSGDIASSYDRQYLVGRKSWLDLMNSVREQAQTKIQLADAEGSLIGASHRLMVYINGTMQFDNPGR
jgi:adhesin transport system outer membrane protein